MKTLTLLLVSALALAAQTVTVDFGALGKATVPLSYQISLEKERLASVTTSGRLGADMAADATSIQILAALLIAGCLASKRSRKAALLGVAVMSVALAEEKKHETPKISEANQIRYWKLMNRVQTAALTAESAEKASLKAREEAQKETAAVQQEFQKLVADLKKDGCEAVQGKDGLECQQTEPSKKKP